MSPPERPRRARMERLMLVMAFAVPVAGFLIAVVMWWAARGRSAEAGAPWTGLMMLAGVALIAAAYWAADRFWIRRR